MDTPATPAVGQQPPAQLPGNFAGWDAPAGTQTTTTPPAALPANFSGWDQSQPAAAPQQSELATEFGQATEGFKKGLNETGLTAMKALHAIPGVGSLLDKTKFGQSEQQTQEIANKPTEGIAGGTGYALENILEFMGGDEALKGLSVGEKLAKLAPVIKIVEKYPRLAQALHLGITTGVGTGVQAAVHGAGPAEALKQGAEGAAGGAALSGVISGAGKGIEALKEAVKPTEEVIGGEKVPVLRTQVPQTGPDGLPERPTRLQKFAVGDQVPQNVRDVQQEAGKRVIQQEAQRATEGAAQTADVPTVVRKVADFGEAADEVEKSAKQQYANLDQATNGQFSEARNAVKDAQKRIWNTTGDALDVAQENLENAQTRLKGILDEAGVSPEDKAAADQTYRKSFQLRELHNAIEPTFDIDAGYSQRSGAYRGFNGNRLNANLNRLTQKNPGIEKLIGQDSMDNLRQIANLNRTQAQRQEWGSAVNAIAHALYGTATAGAYPAAKYVMRALATNPRAGESLIYGLKYGANVERMAPVIAAIIREDHENEK
jgi:hypothetical protein